MIRWLHHSLVYVHVRSDATFLWFGFCSVLRCCGIEQPAYLLLMYTTGS